VTLKLPLPSVNTGLLEGVEVLLVTVFPIPRVHDGRVTGGCDVEQEYQCGRCGGLY
jgi:hypothetical protein